MERSRVYALEVLLVLAVLVVSGCAAPKTTPTPVTAQPTPVAQKASPTQTVATQPTPVAQKASPTPYPLITITFSAGDKCSIDAPASIQSGIIHVDWIVESWEHDTYGLGVGNLDPSKTLEDLHDSLDKHILPDWLYVIDYTEKQKVSGDKFASSYYTNSTMGPLVFSCFWMDPGVDDPSQRIETNFGELGPVEVVKVP